MESFVVIGLGRFGSAVAERLCQEGHQVLAVDVDEKVVQNMADKVTQAVAGDCQEMDVLRALGVQDMNCAVVAFSNDIGKSVLVTLNLKELGVPRIICKARTATHEELLRRIRNLSQRGIAMEPGQTLADVLAFRDPLYRRYAELVVDCPAGQALEHTVPLVRQALEERGLLR